MSHARLFTITLSVVILFTSVSWVSAQENLRERLFQMHIQAKKLADLGRLEDAHQVGRELEHREGHPAERMMHEMMERIEMLAHQVEELRHEVQQLQK